MAALANTADDQPPGATQDGLHRLLEGLGQRIAHREDGSGLCGKGVTAGVKNLAHVCRRPGIRHLNAHTLVDAGMRLMPDVTHLGVGVVLKARRAQRVVQ